MPGFHEYGRELGRQLIGRSQAVSARIALVLDGTGSTDTFLAEKPDAFPGASDGMGIPIIAFLVLLDRFQSLLAEQAQRLSAG
jgi:hypothetical protein